jgi:hypothetical protein
MKTRWRYDNTNFDENQSIYAEEGTDGLTRGHDTTNLSLLINKKIWLVEEAATLSVLRFLDGWHYGPALITLR